MGDLDPEELRAHAHEVADWIADYLANIESRPVLSPVRPGEFRAKLPSAPPAQPEPIGDILRDFDQLVVPASTQWNHPGFHAYFANTASAPGVLAEALSAALNANAMLWKTGPAAAELELQVLDWLCQMFGVPGQWFGQIFDTASISTITALAAARRRAAGPGVRERGVAAITAPRIYCSVETHTSIDKAVMLLGFGLDALVKIPVDEHFAMDAEALAAQIREDRAAGRTPVAVVATLGTTSTTAVDPLRRIGEICRDEDVFLHVDAAYGGALALVPEERAIFDGIELADAFVVNPHKWIFTPMDCSCLWVKDPELLRDAFSVAADYLKTDAQAIDLVNYGPAMGRRFRALKLWFVIRAFGTEGVAARIRHHLELAREFASWVDAADDWDLCLQPRMGTVLYRHLPSKDADEPAIAAHNEKLMACINARGRSYLSQSVVGGTRYALRTSIGNLRTERRHLAQLWQDLRDCANCV